MSAVDKLWEGVREAIQLNAKVDQLFSAVGQHQRRLEDLTERLTRLEARFDTTLQIAGMLKPLRASRRAPGKDLSTGHPRPDPTSGKRNALLLAAGYAPMFREADIDLTTDDLAPVRSALAAMLRQQEPFPAVVMNRH